ncbi:MFS transporter [Saccharopolyspora mangrovi]|uniref:Aromatic acid/H+ symport family MFS transporter n=1 Tax=Saccharopolyspora mangrovi TaxID=3082379 RepID=A0ABU6A4Q7_9PSEU|nr:aromatic acid/H+ symport family MFS transporter [Saccharopolyspora sp. S2-29]MEB3366409.1 aromatic acid/H+ symport family MFS transporter [Saccharopolyspora sp. S2-29]
MASVQSEAQRRRGLWVVAICFTAVVFDGYDLIVYGATLPSILAYEEWHMTPVLAGVIGSYALAGMLVGTLLCGLVTDLIGRRRMMLASIVWFSLFMGACAVAPNAQVFGLFRLLAGIGLGGVLPTAVALTVEFAPKDRRNFFNAMTCSGYSIGAILASLLAIALVQDYGFRVMYAIGTLPLVLLVPLAWKVLPESVEYLAAKGKTAEAHKVAERFGLPVSESATDPDTRTTAKGVLRLFRPPYVALLMVFAVACLIGQLLTYGLNTWLPQIMRTAGYPLGPALQFLVALSLGAIVGALVLSALADRVGGRIVLIGGFAIAVVSLLLMSMNPPTAALYLAVALAGVGANGTMVVLNGYAATQFAADVRASALGVMMGIGKLGAVLGPLVGGWVMAANVGVEWSFYAFLLPAAVGVVTMFFDRGAPRTSEAVREPVVEK